MEALLKAVETASSLDTYAVAYWLSRNKVASFYGALEFDTLNMNSAVISYVQAFENLETSIVLPRTAASRPLAYPIDCVTLHGVSAIQTSKRCMVRDSLSHPSLLGFGDRPTAVSARRKAARIARQTITTWS